MLLNLHMIIFGQINHIISDIIIHQLMMIWKSLDVSKTTINSLFANEDSKIISNLESQKNTTSFNNKIIVSLHELDWDKIF